MIAKGNNTRANPDVQPVSRADLPHLRVGIDVGGTFTDVVAVDATSGETRAFKVRSTPGDPAAAVLEGLKNVLDAFDVDGTSVAFFGHGTTVVTNMIIERVGAPIAVVTTRGFRDVLALARQARPHVYDYRVQRPAPLAPRKHIFEVTERIGPDGSVVTPLDPEDLRGVVEALEMAEMEAVALCFLHAYANDAHEKAAELAIKQALPDVTVSASHIVAREHREFERFATTALNAFVAPRASGYFNRLSSGLDAESITVPLYTVASNGALMDDKTTRTVPVRTALSGPAAGVSGVARILGDVGPCDLVTFDVGGTSTDIAVLEGGMPRLTTHRTVAGHPLLSPMVDIEVIGAGGGSLARIAPGGALHVGPESAGSDPGPAAYGRGGTAATLTDAAVVLGRLGDHVRLSGDARLDAAMAWRAVEKDVALPLGLGVVDAASGILAVAVANIARTIRSAVTARGAEAGGFALVAYGGAGPLLAADVADALGVSRVVIPVAPGTLCARALLASDIARDDARTTVRALDKEGLAALRTEEAAMRTSGAAWLEREGIDPAAQHFTVTLDARYRGQGFEIAVPLLPDDDTARLRTRFDEAHAREQGFSLPERPVEAVTLRLRSFATPAGMAPTRPQGSKDAAPIHKKVRFGAEDFDTSIVPRTAIAGEINGPAIVLEDTATTIIPPGWSAHLLAAGTLVMEPTR